MGHDEIEDEIERALVQIDEAGDQTVPLGDSIVVLREFPTDGPLKDFLVAPLQAGVVRPNAIYLIRHPLDADALRAVRDAIAAEVRAESGRILREVTSGELGERALEHRQQQAADLRQKIGLYEELLGVGLEQLHRAVDEADQAAGVAAILAAAHASAAPETVNGAA